MKKYLLLIVIAILICSTLISQEMVNSKKVISKETLSKEPVPEDVKERDEYRMKNLVRDLDYDEIAYIRPVDIVIRQGDPLIESGILTEKKFSKEYCVQIVNYRENSRSTKKLLFVDISKVSPKYKWIDIPFYGHKGHIPINIIKGYNEKSNLKEVILPDLQYIINDDVYSLLKLKEGEEGYINKIYANSEGVVRLFWNDIYCTKRTDYFYQKIFKYQGKYYIDYSKNNLLEVDI